MAASALHHPSHAPPPPTPRCQAPSTAHRIYRRWRLVCRALPSPFSRPAPAPATPPCYNPVATSSQTRSAPTRSEGPTPPVARARPQGPGGRRHYCRPRRPRRWRPCPC
ncbi:hypothetical protein PVAP13_4KG284000 [Panicum virgatum]|uniref:Uncharacterized protein n=1 Tax=Panicum virgatum TaxID=38727 RepID=A0A8T0TRM3_PANVG|nr:hypothetical protein PVAP13_4KG284000 [Panicum virgatum]